MLTLFALSSHAARNEQWVSTTSGCMVSASSAMAKDITVTWSGRCSDGYADGKGTMTWSNGNRYEGDVYVGVISGKGNFYWANGDWYEGDFKNGRRDGIGTQHFGCTGQYYGEFHNNVMDGVGVMSMVDGNRYEGVFRNGLLEGVGIRYLADGGRYEGEFKRNQQDGIGTLFQANHYRYEGEFKDNHAEGHALVTDENGATFEGMYIDGQVEGRGILSKPNGERDVGTFSSRKGVLRLVSTLGPPLYEPCQTQCSSNVASCNSGNFMAISPDDPTYQTKILDAQISCGNDMRNCTTMCERLNPTARELKGIVEVGEIDDTAGTASPGHVAAGTKSQDAAGHDSSARNTKSSANKEAVNFVDEQIAATNELKARLGKVHEQLKILQQTLKRVSAQKSSGVGSVNKTAGDCPSTPGHKK